MKILFVIPPYRTTDRLVSQLFPLPYGAISMGTVLQEAGHQVTIKDFLIPEQRHKCPQPESFKGYGAPPYMHYGLPLEECVTWLEAHQAEFDLIGLCMGQCNIYETGVALAKCIDKPLVIGGPYVTTATEKAMEQTGADVAVVGEGEWVCEEAFLKAARGEKGVVQGIAGDITSLPLPDWSLAPLEDYPRYNGRVRGVLAVSRGCPWACQFCSVWTVMGRKHRRQSRERIKEELRNLWDVGVRYFCFLDDNLFISEQAVDDVVGAITDLQAEIPKFAKSKFYVEEGIEVRVAAIPGVIERIVCVGFESIAIGLETMSRDARDAMLKPYSDEELALAVQNCKDAGIVAKAFYLIGFPQDTIESVCQDLVRFGKLGLAARPNNLKLYPGTSVTRDFLEKGYIGEDYDWRMSSWHTPSSGNLDYKQIKRLKTVLGALGNVAADLGVAAFGDSVDQIVAALEQHRFSVSRENGSVGIYGKMYRKTAYRYLAGFLLLREGAVGYKAQDADGGILASALTEPADEIQAALGRALRPDTILDLEEWVEPTWVVGDARDMPVEGEFDFLFTCPPYYDLEVYGDDPQDLSNCGTYDQFVGVFREIVKKAAARLKEDRFACIVVGDIRDEKGLYRNFVSDTVSAFVDAGLALYNDAVLVTAVGSLPIRAGIPFRKSRKLGKGHQNVLVFVKGDPVKATEACGPIQLYEPDEVSP